MISGVKTQMKLILGIILFGCTMLAIWHTIATNEMIKTMRGDWGNEW